MVRKLVLVAALLVALAGCAAPEEPAGDGSGTAGESGSAAGSGVDDDTPSALDYPQNPDLPEPLIDLDHLASGGIPPDGIPAIDDPVFQPAGEVDWLDDDEPVLSLTVADETRAYPLQVMTWHEIVNDEVGGVPVAVTYCPLCNSGVAFERTVDGEVLDFGTSGKLYIDNLVMYDRQTESLWPQLTGQASVGHLTGAQLVAIPMGAVGWGQFRSDHPDALVLTRDTGFSRDYGRNPYPGYDDPDGRLLVQPPTEDPRLPVKERVVGIESDGNAVAVRRALLAESGVLEVEVGGRDLVLWHREGQASALDADRIVDGQEVGTVGVFEPTTADGRALTFRPAGAGFEDEETGSAWNVLGRATAGPLKGETLEPVTHLDTFWFAWVGFQPETRLID
ncbi:DUF3179 domain-containing protein [Myceligenerans halotolerans]